MKRAATFLMLSTLIILGPALEAQVFSGSLESRLGWYWGSGDLLPQTQLLGGRLDGKVGDQDQPAAQYSGRLEVAFDPATATTSVALGEAWVKLFAGPFDLSFGNQVVAWSNTDAFWPIDVVNPVDLSLPVDPIRMPVPLGRLVYNGGFLTVDLVAQPYWVAPKLPAAPWAEASPLPATFETVDPTWENAAYGGHVKASLGLLQGLDIGLTAYRGRAYTPSSTPNFTGMVPTSVTLAYDRLTFVGADLVLAPGAGLLLKTEWGYRTLRDSSLLEPEAGAASLEGVSGFEYNLAGVQLIGEYVLDWAKGAAAGGDSLAHSAVGIGSVDIGSRLSLKAAAVHEFKGNSGMVAPQLSYTLADGLKLDCALYFFYGGADTTYGAWKDNSLGRISLKYSF